MPEKLTAQRVITWLGLTRIREACVARAKEELDAALDECNKKYPNLALDRNWVICTGEALADYYKALENCPPFPKEIELPWLSNE